MKSLAKSAVACLLAMVAVSDAQTTQNYADATGDLGSGPSGNNHLDIDNVDVTVDALELAITFTIFVAADPVATNWGKYCVGLRTGPGGTTNGNGWNRPINFSPGMTHWIASWVDTAGGDGTAGGGQIWTYSASTWNQSGTAPTVTKFTDRVELMVPVATLGLDPGETFYFDIYTTGGGGGDGAVDALSVATPSIENWGDSFTTAAIGDVTAPPREFTMPGTLDFSTWIQSWGLDVSDQDPGDDPDGDTLTNQQEFDANLGLNPNDPDTDFDSLDDNLETGTGIYLSPTNTGTLPNEFDTDGDGAGDGDEVDGSSFLGYLSDPTKFNHEFIAVAGSFLVPAWDATAASGEGLLTRAGDSLTEQFQWDGRINITAPGAYGFKFTNAFDWTDFNHWQWGATSTPDLVVRNGGDLSATVTLSGLHNFSLNTDTLAYSFGRTTFADEAEFLAAYNIAADDDSDGDNLTASEEFALGTDPTNPDTDGDGLDDDLETSTDPLDADSDDDGLLDGVENNSGSYGGPGATGTDPNDPDSDGDGENDGFEVDQGTDPTDDTDSSAARGIPAIDGTRDAVYGGPLVVQSIETSFGTQNQLDAAYAKIAEGKLYLLVTGNLNATFEKLEIFIDSETGGSEIFTAVTGNDGSDAMNGMAFDVGFAPDYHLIARRGSNKFDLNFAKFAGDSFDFYENVFGGADFGVGSTGTGTNLSPVKVAYNGSNTAGIGGTAGNAADQAAAAAVTTGLELCLDLADLGSPTGPIQIMVLLANDSHSYLSNQSLGGLPVGTGSLENPQGPPVVDFSGLAGEQFFTVHVSGIGDLQITDVTYLSVSDELQITVTGLTITSDYKVVESSSLLGFTTVPGSQFTATAPSKVVTVSAADPANNYRIELVPTP